MSWRWLQAIIAFAMLFAFGVSMWWFGPPYATRVLGVWMVLTAPLFTVKVTVVPQPRFPAPPEIVRP